MSFPLHRLLLAWVGMVLTATAAWAVPTATTIWVPVRPYPTTQTSIPSLSATTTATGGVTSYNITTLMSTAQGTLYVNGTAVTATRALTPTEATQLTFIPAAGFRGNAFFQYTATDRDGPSTTTNYSIPVGSSTCVATNTNSLDFSKAAQEDWKNHANVAVSGTSLNTSGYSAPEATASNIFSTGTNGQLIGSALVWQLSSNNATTTAATADVATVTFNFTRPVNNLSLALQDLDANATGSDFIDEVTFDGYASTSATTPATLTGPNVGLSTNNTNAFIGSGSGATNSRNNTVQGIAANGSVAGAITVTFTTAVQKLVITYRNTKAFTNGNLRLQALGIQSMSWCAQNDVYASFTAVPSPSTVNAGSSVSYTVQFGNNGVDAATNETRVVTLPAGATVTNNGGGTYNATTNTIDFGTATVVSGSSNSFTYTYTVPSAGGSYTNSAAAGTGTYTTASPNSSGATSADDSNTANNVVSSTLGVTASADVVTTLSTSATSTTAGGSVTYTATVQNNGPSVAANVAPTVQLSKGLASAGALTLPAGASYNNNTGVLTLPTTASLATGAANALSYAIGFKAPNYTTTITGQASSKSDTSDPTATNNDGSATNANVQTVVTLTSNNNCAGTAYPNAGGSGLYAEYYAGYFNDVLTFFDNNTPGLTRTDGNVNFSANTSWGNIAPPATGTGADNPDSFSARYRGTLNITTAGSYTFYLTSDEASYLWIDRGAGNPTLATAAINNGGTHNATLKQITLTLSAGPHGILLLYGENTGDNSLVLEYQGPDTNSNRQVIPGSALCPTYTTDLATIISGPTTAVVGQTVYYQSSTTNNGTASAAGTTTTITLANKPAAGTVTVTNGTYDASTGTVTFNNGTLASGATVTNTVSFVAQATPTSATGQAASTTTSGDIDATNNNGSATAANVTTVVSPTGASGTPANCATAGKDGAVASLTTNPNAYYPSATTQTLAANATRISVGAATGAATDIKPGDLLLVIQMQGADIDASNTDSYGDGISGNSANGSSVTTNFTAGQYEYVTVAASSGSVTAAAGGTITLATGLKNSYVSAAATATTGQRSFQVVRIPQYSNLTLGANLVPTPWNGSTGGIIALDVAGQLNFNSFTIDASGTGFRGGAGRNLTGDNSGTTNTDYRSSASQNTGGTKGEGIAGTPRYVNNSGALLDTQTAAAGVPTTLAQANGYPGGDNGRGAPGNAGGGGTDGHTAQNDFNTGGGGGANGGRGGRGGNAWNSGAAVGGEPGAAFPAASSSRLVFGGGGGAGSINNNTGTPGAGFASSGAAGGGVVLVRTGTVSGTGSILANGAAANNTVANDGSGGGGAGGSILVTATNSQAGLANLTLSAKGGTGGTNTPGTNVTAHGPGGGGGGGLILATGTVGSTSSAAAGANGTTTGGAAYGAEAGTIGVGNSSVSNSVAGSTAGATCVADVATTITGPTTAKTGQATGNFTVTFANNGAQAASSVTQTVTLPTGAGLTTAQQAAISGAYSGTTFATTGSGASAVTTINFGTVTSLASGASNAFTFAFTAPATIPAVGYITTTSNTSTTTAEGGLTSNNAATVNTTLTPAADVTVALAGPTTLGASQPTGTFTATFTNEGPQAASSVTQTVTLPTGASLTTTQQNDLISRYSLTASSFTTTGSGASAVTTINFGTVSSLASGASNAFTFAFTAPAATGGSTITGNTSTSSDEAGNAAPNSSSLALNTTIATDLVASISTPNASVAPGSTGTFNVRFTNPGSQSAAGVAYTVQLPAGLNTSLQTVAASNGGSYNNTTGLVTYSSAATTLGSTGSFSSDITFAMPGSGTVTGTANVTTTTAEGNTANNVAAATITAAPSFDLTTTLSGPTAAVAGSPVTLSVTTTNKGPQAVAGAIETVQLAAGLNATGAPNVFVSNGGTYDNASGLVTFPALGALPSGQTVTNTITFTAPSTAFAPQAQVTPNTTAAGETDVNNNKAFLNGATTSTNLPVSPATTTKANVFASISTTSTIVDAGTQVTFTTGIGNDGPATATNVTGQLQLIPGLTTSTLKVAGQTGTLVDNTITFTTAGVTYNTTTGLLTYGTIPSLASGTSSTTSVVVTVPATIGNNGQLLATMSVSAGTATGAGTSDNVPADNVKAVTVTVRPTTDLATTIVGPTSATAGQTVSYVATFANNGPDAASATAETVQLPTGLGVVTVTDAQGNVVTGASYSATTGVVTLPLIASDAVGSTQTFSVAFAAPARAYTVSSAITSGTTETNTANNSASVGTTVGTLPADVAVAVSGPATAVAGNPVTYVVTASNNGPSAASTVVTKLQLPANLANVAAGPNATYDAGTGLVTFNQLSSLPAGGSAVNYVTFTMPTSPANGQVTGVATVSTASTDNVATNNTAGINTDVAPATTDVADLVTSISAPASPATAGSQLSYTFNYRNNNSNAVNSAAPAVNVLPVASIPTGLAATSGFTVGGQAGTLSGSLITFPNGTTYSPATGLLTFPTIASQPAGDLTSYTVVFPAPGNGPLVVVSAVSSSTTDNGPGANRASNQINITAAYDATTSISGPTSTQSGTLNAYTVTTTNNGPSANPSTTQKVTLPNKPAASAVTNISNSGTYDAGTGVITFPAITNLAAGASVTNSFTVAMPTSGSQVLTASVSSDGESRTDNNSATLTTAPSNFAPVAQHIINSLQSVRGNTALALPISNLNATDADGSIDSYNLTSLPDASQGVLYYNGAAATQGQKVAASGLSFKPATTFVGNAFFTYTATDNSGALSNTALYTIPVAQDQSTTYTATPTKGNGNPYAKDDVLAYTIDPNTAVYNGQGLVYSTTGTIQSNPGGNLAVTNGVSNAVLDAAGKGPSGNTDNQLPSGVDLDAATGRIYVKDASQLPRVTTATTYSVNVITTDLNGGINTTTATFVLGAYPLPVELVSFTAQAVQNRDALLYWTTASELNNDHFELERSLDGATFVQVGKVTGQGTKATPTNYTFTDAGIGTKVTAGQPVFYRLRQVDISGTSSYSPVRSVSFRTATPVSLTLYPNPVATTTNLDLSALPNGASYQVMVLDATGRQVRAVTLGGGTVQLLDLRDLATGTYQVLVTGQQANGYSLRQVVRLIKE